MSRSLKPIPNLHVQSLFKDYEYLDGELICGDPYSPSCYRDTNSAVMSKDGTPNVKLYVFDCIKNQKEPFSDRFAMARAIVAKATVEAGDERCEMVEQTLVSSMEELLRVERRHVDRGAEGVMLRGINGIYKNGRSSAKEAILTKLKRFTDSEFVVVNYEERMFNGNIATTNALGHTERSSHKENKTGRGDLGALVLQDGDETFNCGAGFTDADRAAFWAIRDSLIGKVAKVKHFDYGVKDKVRFPTFLGFRDPIDL